MLQALSIILLSSLEKEGESVWKIILSACTTSQKKYGRFVALNSVSLNVERGEIYGLIGENGAGKSTLIRIINGLTAPTSGELVIFGHAKPEDIRCLRSRIGYMPDTNAFYPNLSASDNLLVRCMEWGIPQLSNEEILRLVGLEDAGRKRARDFSMGMKRRLDLAIALLGDPDLLILDEPTNGLDPMGIVEVREMLFDINGRLGKTILISSHNLEELYKLATCYEFISHGVILRSANAAEIEADCRKRLVLRVQEPDSALLELRRRVSSKVYIDGRDLIVEADQESSAEIVRLLTDAGICVNEAFTEKQSLEEYYTDLVACEGDR